MAIFSPKVTGSAWMPWVRPIMRFSCAGGLFFQDGQQLVDIGKEDVRSLLQKQGKGSVEDVRDVSPMWMKRESGPTNSATFVKRRSRRA